MKIGFCYRDITPPPGLMLGGYAVTRKSTGVHDSLFCKTVIFEQSQKLFVLIALDLLCVDSALCKRIADSLSPKGVAATDLLVCATHTHSGPKGATTSEGALAGLEEIFGDINCDFIDTIVQAAVESFDEAYQGLESYQIRIGRAEAPPIGSERHDNTPIKGCMTAAEIRCNSGRRLVLYSFPCHPTVMSAQNLEMSADFPGYINQMLDCDMAVFLNGACGDISTRFVRRESSFEECKRLATLAVGKIQELLATQTFRDALPITGQCRKVTLVAKQVEEETVAATRLQELTAQWQQGIAKGESQDKLRILKSFVEGAETNLQLARTLKGVSSFEISVTAFAFNGFRFATVPGELFSTLVPSGDVAALCYANGYNLYIADSKAYSQGCYEALSSVLAEGEGEKLSRTLSEMCSIL